MATCYLSKNQMTALLRQAEAEGLAKQQIIKRALVRLLVEEGRLPETELQATEARQRALAISPHSNRKEVSELRNARPQTEEERIREEQNARLRETLKEVDKRINPEKYVSEESSAPRVRRRRRPR